MPQQGHSACRGDCGISAIAMWVKGQASRIDTRGIADYGIVQSIQFHNPNSYVAELCTKRPTRGWASAVAVDAREALTRLNRVARSVIESCRGKHPERVFTRNGHPITKIYNSGWKSARQRASERYAKEFERPCPQGFRSLRVHDLKHTFGHRLRAAGIGFEDRKVLLGHKSDHVTTHYSAPEIGMLIAAAERECELGSRKSHALTLMRAQAVRVST